MGKASKTGEAENLVQTLVYFALAGSAGKRTRERWRKKLLTIGRRYPFDLRIRGTIGDEKVSEHFAGFARREPDQQRDQRPSGDELLGAVLSVLPANIAALIKREVPRVRFDRLADKWKQDGKVLADCCKRSVTQSGPVTVELD